jgi:hypothetical protein
MRIGSAIKERLRSGAGLRPAWFRWARAPLSVGVGLFAYGGIDEQAPDGRYWLVGLSIIGVVAIVAEVHRRRAHGVRWNARAAVMLALLAAVFVFGAIQGALYELQ